MCFVYAEQNWKENNNKVIRVLRLIVLTLSNVYMTTKPVRFSNGVSDLTSPSWDTP